MTGYTCPYCDVFAYDTPEGLTEHLIAAHSTPEAAPVPTATQATPPTSGGLWPPPRTSAPAPAPAPVATAVRPASDGQKRYLRILLAAHPDEDIDVESISLDDAKVEIDRLKKLPQARPQPQPQPQPQYGQPQPQVMVAYGQQPQAPQPQPSAVPTGLHFRDGVIYRVSQSKSTGNLYVKVLHPGINGRGGTWSYEAGRPLSLLSHETLVQNDASGAWNR